MENRGVQVQFTDEDHFDAVRTSNKTKRQRLLVTAWSRLAVAMESSEVNEIRDEVDDIDEDVGYSIEGIEVDAEGTVICDLMVHRRIRRPLSELPIDSPEQATKIKQMIAELAERTRAITK
jgi:hypothetical protein